VKTQLLVAMDGVSNDSEEQKTVIVLGPPSLPPQSMTLENKIPTYEKLNLTRGYESSMGTR
jgi:hypothetical protein